MKLFVPVFVLLFAFSSCQGPYRQFAGTMIGAHVGGVLGSAILGGNNSYSGAVIGDVVGTIAGAAIGSSIASSGNSHLNDVAIDQAQDHNIDHDYDATIRQRKPSYKLIPIRTENSKAVADLRVVNLRFIDDNRNRIINSNESCLLIFDIRNDGKVAVDEITPSIFVVDHTSHIELSDPSIIHHIEPGESISYKIQLRTKSNLLKDKVTFCIELTTNDGLTVPCREFDIETAP